MPHADHPRACGANPDTVHEAYVEHGSSPRMRGKLICITGVCAHTRIIPAHAGQTGTLRSDRRRKTDHPRACGANYPSRKSAGVLSGSSPRMRGKLHAVVTVTLGERIIPAHAGQTASKQPTHTGTTDHPRACGANFLVGGEQFGVAGSSPRMRGKQSDFMRKLLSAGPSIIGFAQWLQSSYYCSCLQSSAKTPISRGTTPTSLFLGFQNSITLLLLT